MMSKHQGKPKSNHAQQGTAAQPLPEEILKPPHTNGLFGGIRDLQSVFLPKILPRLCGDPHFVLPPSWMNIRELEKPKLNQSNSTPSHLQQLFLARAATLLSCLTLNCAE